MFPRKQLKQIGILCFVLGVAVFAGCGFSQAQSSDTAKLKDATTTVKTTMTENDEAQLVPVSAISFNGDKISAGVISFGCTTSADFTVDHAIVNGQCELKINRVNRDVCRRAPFVANIELEWSLPDDCHDLKIVVANPLLVTSSDNTIKKQMK